MLFSVENHISIQPKQNQTALGNVKFNWLVHCKLNMVTGLFISFTCLVYNSHLGVFSSVTTFCQRSLEPESILFIGFLPMLRLETLRQLSFRVTENLLAVLHPQYTFDLRRPSKLLSTCTCILQISLPSWMESLSLSFSVLLPNCSML